MVRRCVICGAKKSATLSFHKFPTNVQQHQIWKEICNFEERDDLSKGYICRKHFKPDDFSTSNTYLGRGSLKPGIYPSVDVPRPGKIPAPLPTLSTQNSSFIEIIPENSSFRKIMPQPATQNSSFIKIIPQPAAQNSSFLKIISQPGTQNSSFVKVTPQQAIQNSSFIKIIPQSILSKPMLSSTIIPQPVLSKPILPSTNPPRPVLSKPILSIANIPQPVLSKPMLPTTTIPKVSSSMEPTQTPLPFETVIITPITNSSIVKIEVEEPEENDPSEAIKNPENVFFRNIKSEDISENSFSDCHESDKQLISQNDMKTEEISITEWEYSDTYKEVVADIKNKDLSISKTVHFAGNKTNEITYTNSDSGSLDTSDSDSFDEETSDKSLLYQSKFAFARFIGDIKPEHFSTPQRTEITLRLIRETYKQQSLKIKKYQQNIRRLEDKIKRLQKLVMKLNQDKINELNMTDSADPLESFSNDEDRPKINKSDRLYDITSVHSYAKTEDTTKTTNTRKCIVNGCDKEFLTIPLLRTHMKTDHKGTYLYICMHCAQGFNNLNFLTSHEKLHKNLKCGKCDKEFNIPRALFIHNKQEHRNEIFYCCHCGKSFKKMQACKTHELIHNKTKPFSCPECNKPFHSKYQMNRHIKFRHLGQKNFACTLCSKKFTTNAILQSHIKNHREEEGPSENEMQ